VWAPDHGQVTVVGGGAGDGKERLLEREDACIGSISEIFDAEPPFTPRGCIAQAWSVAEVLRVLTRTSEPTEVPEVRPR
jgi:glycogen debranching enzyme